MDLTPFIVQIPELLREYEEMIGSRTIVACLGNMKWLGAFLCITPISQHLVGAATTEAEGFRLVEHHRPEFLIVSEELEGGSGISLVRRAETLNPRIRTILVLHNPSESLIREGLAAGCDAICLETELFTPVFRVVAGGGVYYPKLVGDVLRSTPEAVGEPPVADLTARETEILSLVMLGLTNQEIARRLMLSHETIKTHLGNILVKLNARDRTHAAVIGIAAGLIALEDVLPSGIEALRAF